MKFEDLFVDSQRAQALLKQRFQKLSDVELADVGASYHKLVRLIGEKYQLSEPNAQVQVSDFVTELQVIHIRKPVVVDLNTGSFKLSRFGKLDNLIVSLPGEDDTTYGDENG